MWVSPFPCHSTGENSKGVTPWRPQQARVTAPGDVGASRRAGVRSERSKMRTYRSSHRLSTHTCPFKSSNSHCPASCGELGPFLPPGLRPGPSCECPGAPDSAHRLHRGLPGFSPTPVLEGDVHPACLSLRNPIYRHLFREMLSPPKYHPIAQHFKICVFVPRSSADL